MLTKDNTNKLILGAGVAIGAAILAAALVPKIRATEFAGKVVLITGGSRGLGILLARRFAAEGAKVALCARDAAELERARQDLIARGAKPENVFIHACDITVAEQVMETVQAVEERFGRVDVLVNNAGVIQVGPMEVMTEADFENAFATHFWAPYRFVEAVLPGMRTRGAGRIVNISSIGGVVSVPHLLPYSASKFALVGYSQGLRAELMKDNILVTTVCPGLIRTGSPQNALFKGQHQKEYLWFALGDSLPGASMSADKAADQIIAAARSGDAFLVTSLTAQVAALLHGVFPGVTADLMGIVNQTILPGAEGGVGTESRKGHESETLLTRSILTFLTQKAAANNNENGAVSPSAS